MCLNLTQYNYQHIYYDVLMLFNGYNKLHVHNRQSNRLTTLKPNGVGLLQRAHHENGKKAWHVPFISHIAHGHQEYTEPEGRGWRSGVK